MRLTLIQMNSRAAARDENVERACAFVDEAARQHPDIVVLPEFFNVDPVGKILVQASGTEKQVVSAEIERESVIRARQRFLLARDRRPDAYGAITTITEHLHE